MTEDYDGPERREGYKEIAARLDEHVVHIEERFRKWFLMGLIAFAVIGIAVAIALAGFGFVLREQANFTREQCREQNRRHDNAIRTYNVQALILLRRRPELAPQIRQNRRANIAIIEAIAPKQECGDIPG